MSDIDTAALRLATSAVSRLRGDLYSSRKPTPPTDRQFAEAAVRAYLSALPCQEPVGMPGGDGINSPLNSCRYRDDCRAMMALLVRVKDHIINNAGDLSMNSTAVLLVEEIVAAIRPSDALRPNR